MIARFPRSLVLSALLHGLVLAAMLWFMMPAPREPFMVPSVFVLTPVTSPGQGAAAENPAASSVRFIAPPIPVRPVALSEDVSGAAPENVRSAAPAQLASSRRAPAVAPVVPARITAPTSLEEFRRLHPTPAVATSVRHSSSVPVKINMDTVLMAADDGRSAPASQAVAAAQSDAYQARLLEKLRAAHEKPAGLDGGLQVQVEFSLRADGTLVGVRLLESSGSPEFDASVLAAFRKLRELGAPPSGLVGVNRVTFRTNSSG
jgi:colicin import membrane protein